MTPSGDITWDGTSIPISPEFQQAGGGGAAPRLDGRVAVSGSLDLSTSFSVNGSGEVTVIDEVLLGMDNTHLLPNGLGVVGGFSFRLIDITRDGIFPGSFSSAPTVFMLGATVTHDGRFVLFNDECSGPGTCLSVYRATSFPASLEEVFVLPGQASWGEIEFIPPRTEDLLGDANADGRRDITDIVTYTNHFVDDPGLGGPTDPTIAGPVPRARADADQDGDIDPDDLSWLVDFLLGI
jgi:hypothetical protein